MVLSLFHSPPACALSALAHSRYRLVLLLPRCGAPNVGSGAAVLNANQVDYWLDGHTLLAVYRSNKVSEWCAPVFGRRILCAYCTACEDADGQGYWSGMIVWCWACSKRTNPSCGTSYGQPSSRGVDTTSRNTEYALGPRVSFCAHCGVWREAACGGAKQPSFVSPPLRYPPATLQQTSLPRHLHL